MLQKKAPLHNTRAVVFDFDGTLAFLNIDFLSMRDQVLSLVRRFGVDESLIQERYLLEQIDEVCQILYDKNPPGVEPFYEEAHRILHQNELKAAEEGRLLHKTPSPVVPPGQKLREYTEAEIQQFLDEDRIDEGTAAAVRRLLASGEL